MSIFSSKEIFADALDMAPRDNINSLHGKAWELTQQKIAKYYKGKVDAFLETIELPQKVRKNLKRAMLRPIITEEKTYSNFMEEASRRVSQSIQKTCGDIAEYCVRRELEKHGLKKDVHFSVKRGQGADIIVYYPNMNSNKKRHRIEVKNVKMRERGIRGLSYDGDSLIGFFNDIGEFGLEAVKEINRECTKKTGYAYVSPLIYNFLKRNKQLTSNTRIKLNTGIGNDMANFRKTGKL